MRATDRHEQKMIIETIAPYKIMPDDNESLRELKRGILHSAQDIMWGRALQTFDVAEISRVDFWYASGYSEGRSLITKLLGDLRNMKRGGFRQGTNPYGLLPVVGR